MSIRKEIIQRFYRVPVVSVVTTQDGSGARKARALDIALMSVGFKLSAELFARLSERHWVHVSELYDDIIGAVRELVGDHVRHNVYFKHFPVGVPDTEEFWMDCLFDALGRPESMLRTGMQIAAGSVNLVDLPKYGRYQHSYDDMVAVHMGYVPSINDKLKILHLGGTLEEEAVDLYRSLAASRVPVNDADRTLLRSLAELCPGDATEIPVRENRAIVNAARVKTDYPPVADTATDILRLACELSDGDVTLENPTKFKSLPRKVRKALLGHLNAIIGNNRNKMYDMLQYREEWKRLFERLHPHEYPKLEFVHLAQNHLRFGMRSTAAQVDDYLRTGCAIAAMRRLKPTPGVLFRNLDRILRTPSQDFAAASKDRDFVKELADVMPKVSGRALLSVREHLWNRVLGQKLGVSASADRKRIFANSKGTAYVLPDTRGPLDDAVFPIMDALDKELASRLPKPKYLVVDPLITSVALPLSEKNKATGFGIMPRGSVFAVTGDILRFFVYWKQKQERTDYDLSALLLDSNLNGIHASWTRLRGDDFAHSGDLVDATTGASEFIDVRLSARNIDVIIPQVNLYAGEPFDKCEESFFGFMERDAFEQHSSGRGRQLYGKPFEARSVRMKSELRGSNRVALPLVFFRQGATWLAKWMHLSLKGASFANTVEKNKVSTKMLVRAIMEREYLSVGYLVALISLGNGTAIMDYVPTDRGPVTYIGIERPEWLPEGSTVYTLNNLKDLIPA